MDPSALRTAGAVASAHACSACTKDFQDAFLRDFHGVPVCVDCYRELNLLTLPALTAETDDALLARLLSVEQEKIAPGPRRRYGIVERYASLIDPAGAEPLVLSAARAGNDSGIPEVLWVLLAVDAVLRSGGKNGKRPLEGKDMSLLLNLAARVGLDVGWAAMQDAGIAGRTLDERGAEWVYEDKAAPDMDTPAGVTHKKEAFVRYLKALRAKVDILAADVDNRNDSVDIALGILKRTADDVLAAVSMMDMPHRGRPGPSN